jgi:putative ABC transport system permease protein
MIRNYLKIAFRSLLKQKIYSFINILGLSTGIASCVLIVMFVADELSYDAFHLKGDRIYKVALERKYPTYSINYAVVPYSYGDAMQQDFGEVESVMKMGGPYNNNGVHIVGKDNREKVFEEQFIMAADSNFFSVLDFKLLEGDPRKVLLQPFSIVLTESTAGRYFGKDEAVGQQLRVFGRDFTVTGVCENIPENSHIKFDLLFKRDEQFLNEGRPNFLGFDSHIYILLKPDADPAALERKFPKMVETYAAAQMGSGWSEYRKAGNDYRYFLQPLRKVHLDPINIEGKIKPGGNAIYIYFLSCIAALILLIACINFMNLATARSAERGREVGVRKTMGSLRGQLVKQFLTESLLVSLFATGLALIIVYTYLPSFNVLANKHLSLSLDGRMIAGLGAIIILVGLLAGSYPAFVLSSFNPVMVLKGQMSKMKGNVMRNGLVIFQFMISIVLIAGTLVVIGQMDFMQQKSLGYNQDQVIVVERVLALEGKGQTFIDEVKRIAHVENAGGSFILLGGNRAGDLFGEMWSEEGSSERLTTKSMVIDDDFASVMGLEIIEGRGFSKETNDSLSLIVNETAVRSFRITDPIGKRLKLNGNGDTFTIVGVVRDFNFQSLHDPITPLTIRSKENFVGGVAYAFVRVKGRNVRPVLADIENTWKTLAPGQPFTYLFLDENLKAQYDNEKLAGQIFSMFSGIAIIIACVGLFGLAAYTANQRTKEIGIRKVLGASMPAVVLMLSKDFTRLVLIAFLLATPLAWYLMDRWLEGFAYHIDLGPGVFIAAGASALVIAWLTVSFQSIKAAIANPVKSLRSE